MPSFLSIIKNDFKSRDFKRGDEDDVKTNFCSAIVAPIIKHFHLKYHYHGEVTNKLNGRIDGTFSNIIFEYKYYGRFKEPHGIKDAVSGRKNVPTDHGLDSYLIGHADIKPSDKPDIMAKKISAMLGIGFDGTKFIFVRYKITSTEHKISMKQTALGKKHPYYTLPLTFVEHDEDFDQGLADLVVVMRQGLNKLPLTKNNLINEINPKNPFVRKSINELYHYAKNVYDDPNSSRAPILYDEWKRVFGKIYGKEGEATDFTSFVPELRRMYKIQDPHVDSQMYLFAMQTFFNMFEKLMVFEFIAQIVDPAFDLDHHYNKVEQTQLFHGKLKGGQERIINNFFETHYLEWFTFVGNSKSPDVKIVNNIIDLLNKFDLATFQLRPEFVQDLLQEVYMALIPTKMRHIMGEYFSPDWIVQRALDMAGYHGDINQSLIDPACGDGQFITQAIKRIIIAKHNNFDYNDLRTICDHLTGFDINPISVIGAKANFILAIFSAYNSSHIQQDFPPSDRQAGIKSLTIPCYAADSVLAPVVYSQSTDNIVRAHTVVGDFVMPRFDNVRDSNNFLNKLSRYIARGYNFDKTWTLLNAFKLVNSNQKDLIEKLYNKLYLLNQTGKDSFWPIILKNTFAPILLKNKYDFVVGNPPWIAWKSMSKSYRKGTLNIWKSYGIFNKNAYDKKTTHDDFGMAMTYVAIDQYLKNNGTMVFLLPKSFFKSEKGGQGFRKFKITRHGQDINFAIDELDDFSDFSKNQLFNVNTTAAKIIKGKTMHYPFNNYIVWKQNHRREKISSHRSWDNLKQGLYNYKLTTRPINANQTSPWLTLPMSFINKLDLVGKILSDNTKRYYKGRKGIEPAGAKGVYELDRVKNIPGSTDLSIHNNMNRQRRKDLKKLGTHPGTVENKYIYPMLSGRDLSRWSVKNCEFMIVPHDKNNLYGISEHDLEKNAPLTYNWLSYYHDGLLASRIQNGKFFNQKTQPFYRLDNVGTYTFAPWKVLWKEQTSSMSAVVVHTYNTSVPDANKQLFPDDKIIVADSKVLMLSLNNGNEAYYVCGIINAPLIRTIIDSYAINTNRGIDVLQNIYIPKFDPSNQLMMNISKLSREIHQLALKSEDIKDKESKLNDNVIKFYKNL